jgi:hypothetical protein
MKYLTIIALSTLVFLGVGWGVSAFALEVLDISNDEMMLALTLGPIGAGAALGFVVGIIASVLTAIEGRGKRKQQGDSTASGT